MLSCLTTVATLWAGVQAAPAAMPGGIAVAYHHVDLKVERQAK